MTSPKKVDKAMISKIEAATACAQKSGLNQVKKFATSVQQDDHPVI